MHGFVVLSDIGVSPFFLLFYFFVVEW